MSRVPFIRCVCMCVCVCTQASTQGLVKELESLGEARGARILCPVPLVTGERCLARDAGSAM